MYRFFFVSIIVLTTFLSISLSRAMGQDKVSSPNGKEITFRDLLQELGDKYDCFFTLEVVVDPINFRHSLVEQTLTNSLSQKSLVGELDRLKISVPNFSYQVKDSKVIRIFDMRLANEESYVMEKIVDDFRFKGSLSDMVNVLRGRGLTVASNGAVDTREYLVIDFSTEVNINETRKRVDEILTKSIIPHKGRSRVLWLAQTKLGENQTTYIRYLK